MSEELYTYTQVDGDSQIEEILQLQKKNLKSALDKDVIVTDGFVTCDHDLKLLKKMNTPHSHVIGVFDSKVIGYCLVMSPIWKDELEVLKSMFAMIERQSWDNKMITSSDYITMGQVCIDKEHRGKGVFRKMYDHYRHVLSPHFKYCITEVATSNHRSRDAHQAIGFEPLLSYQASDGHSWELIIWDWNK